MKWLTRILDDAAVELAALNKSEYRQWVAYLFESIEAHDLHKDAWRLSEARRLLNERIERGGW